MNRAREIQLIEPELRLTHDLVPHLPRFRAYKKFKALQSSAEFSQLRQEVKRVTTGMEWKNQVHCTEQRRHIRVLAWNVERGRNLEGVIGQLKNHEELAQADILLLTELDIGMGRSGNANVPLEIANALGMNYCFANSFLNLAKGDIGEQDHPHENTLGLHGVGIFSRFRLLSAQTTVMPEGERIFQKLDKRLGRKRALNCKVYIGQSNYDFSVIHLDVHTSPKMRARQLETLLQALQSSDARASLIGGDFNTCTYNLGGRVGLAANLLYKMFFLGFKGAIEHYMTPEKIFERPVFEVLKKYEYEIDRFNDRSKGTLYYDTRDLNSRKKSLAYIPEFGLNWLEKKLAPWDGCVPLRLDWLVAKGFPGIASAPQVIERPLWNGRTISDHNPIYADILLPQ